MPTLKPITILAIETSCDETAAAVLRGYPSTAMPSFQTLSSIVRSQIKLHAPLGGVVPEAAARAHSRAIRPVIERALTAAFPAKINARGVHYAKQKLADRASEILRRRIDLIAVTAGPGLLPSLVIGVEFAKALSLATGKPMLAINHMEGHLYSPLGSTNRGGKIPIPSQKTKNQRPKIAFPILSLIVSGGHTMLVLQKDEAHYRVLGSTVDDAAGEAFDKVAHLLGLPYPGGPEISRLAIEGQNNIPLPRPMLDSPDFNFSFSGLKTAVLYHLQKTYETNINKNKPRASLHSQNFANIPHQDKADIAKSFEEAVVEVLTAKALRAAEKYHCKTVSLSGGVAANRSLRARLHELCAMKDINFIVPDFHLCTDNAEMIALAAYFKLRAGYKPVRFSQVKADSSWEL